MPVKKILINKNAIIIQIEMLTLLQVAHFLDTGQPVGPAR